jgi:hypothetical protein
MPLGIIKMIFKKFLVNFSRAGTIAYFPLPINYRDYTSVADPDPGSGAFLPPESGIRDGAMVGSGSGIS